MKKSIYIILILSMITFCGCSTTESYSSYNEDNQLVRLGNYKGLEYEELVANVTIDDVNRHIDSILQSYEEIYEINDRVRVEAYDTIKIDYKVFYRDEITNRVNGFQFKLGNNEIEKSFEEELINQKVGDLIEFEMKVPEGSDEKLSGENVTIQATITNIYGFSVVELTDKFVQSEFGYENIQEYRLDIRQKLFEADEIRCINSIKEKLLAQIINDSEFYLSEEVILENAAGIVESYYRIADVYGYSLNDYIVKVLKSNENDFYENCYNESRNQIKEILVLNEISNIEKLDVSFQDLNLIDSDTDYSLVLDYIYSVSIPY